MKAPPSGPFSSASALNLNEPAYCRECGQSIPDDVKDVEAWSERMGRVLAATPSDTGTVSATAGGDAELCMDLRCLGQHSEAGWLDMIKTRAAARIEEIIDERKDWARRFTLDGVTPWIWMARAESAERLAEQRGELLREAEKDTERYRAQLIERNDAVIQWCDVLDKAGEAFDLDVTNQNHGDYFCTVSKNAGLARLVCEEDNAALSRKPAQEGNAGAATQGERDG